MKTSLSLGARLLLRHKKAILLGYLVNLLVAALLLPAFLVTFEESLGQGVYPEKMVERLDYDWYQLFRDRAEGFAATFSPAVSGFGPFVEQWEALLDGRFWTIPVSLVALAGLYLVLNSFMTAAVVGSLAYDPQGTTVREFFRTGGEFFGRFFRIMALSLLLFGLLFLVVVSPLSSLIARQTADLANDHLIFIWRFGGYLAVALIFAWVNLLLDYTRVITALSDRTSVLLAFFSALGFVISHFFRTAGLYLSLLLVALLWMVGMVTLESWIPQVGWWGILTAIVLQQTYLAGRIGVRYLFYAAQMQLYLKHEGLFRVPTQETTELPVVEA